MFKYCGTVQASKYYVVMPDTRGKIINADSERDAKAKAFDYIQKNIDNITLTEIHDMTIVKDDRREK